MATKNIDARNLTVTGAHLAVPDDDKHVTVQDDVIVIITQAFGPEGDDLIEASTVDFDGYPGIPVKVRGAGMEGVVHLSPFHGDRRKVGMENMPAGTKCEVLCPISGTALERVGPVTPGDKGGADYRAIYLTRRMSEGDMVLISDVWDDYHSRVIDNFDLISSWAVDET